MHVDDRLATVLAVRATGENQVRVQYRQLLDLLGTTPADARGDLLDAALLRLTELARAIPVDQRARAVAEPGLRLRNPRVVAELAHDHPRVAAAMVGNARLSEDQWLDLLPVLPAGVRGLLRDRAGLGDRLHQRLAQLGDGYASLPAGPEPVEAAGNVHALRPAEPAPPERTSAERTLAERTLAERTLAERTLAGPSPAEPVVAPVAQSPAPAPPPAAPPPPAPLRTDSDATDISRIAAGPDGIGAIVRRIAAYRRNREMATMAAANDAPQLPLTPDATAPTIQAFAFACDQGGRISSADAAVAGMTVGLLLPVTGDPASPIGELFRKRQPIRLAPVTLDGAPAIAGSWILDATPEFDQAGRFTGYVGKLRRPATAAAAGRGGTDSDRLRQILHELRTPVNAIQGFSELIHQQLVGPVPHSYRAVAAGIAADAARMLAGFDEMDRLVKLDAGALQLAPGTSALGPIVARIAAQLESFTAPRQSGFTVQAQPGAEAATVGVAGPEAEQLLWRILATFATVSAPGERLPIAFALSDGPGGLRAVRLEIAMPAALADLGDPLEAAPPAAAQPVSGSLFGSGFALRLAMAEAAAAGGSLTLDDGRAVLSLPRAGSGGLTEPFRVSNPVPEVSALTAG